MKGLLRNLAMVVIDLLLLLLKALLTLLVGVRRLFLISPGPLMAATILHSPIVSIVGKCRVRIDAIAVIVVVHTPRASLFVSRALDTTYTMVCVLGVSVGNNTRLAMQRSSFSCARVSAIIIEGTTTAAITAPIVVFGMISVTITVTVSVA